MLDGSVLSSACIAASQLPTARRLRLQLALSEKVGSLYAILELWDMRSSGLARIARMRRLREIVKANHLYCPMPDLSFHGPK